MGRPTKEESAEKAVIHSNRPEQGGAGSDAKPVDRATLSHNWQANSPAIDLSYPGSANAVNTVEAAKAAENVPEPKTEKLTDDEYNRRTQLDVSSPLYINPSLDHDVVKTHRKISDGDKVSRKEFVSVSDGVVVK